MEIQLIKLHEKQKEIVRAILRNDIFFCVAIIGRQFGKTTMAENLALYWAINNDNVIVYWVSPTNNQAFKVYEEILNAIIHTGCIKSNKGSGGMMEIEMLNGSKIQFRSAEAENNLRGGSVHYMILDEAAFIKKSTFETILEPMLTVKGRKCIFISTPKGKNYLYELYQRGMINTPKWVSFRFRTIDSPLANREFILEKKASLNEKIYLQEYEAEFVDSASLFSNLPDVMVLDKLESPIPNDEYYAGVDIGLINDASVLSILDSDGNLVNYFRWENIQSPDLIKEIIRLNSIWNFKSIDIENNNQGLPIYQDISTKLNNVYSMNTNQKTKPEMINRLVYLFNSKEMKLFKDEYLRIELEAFIFKQSDGGSIKFMADNGFHDDCVMSLAIARNCYERNRNKKTNYQFFTIDI
jgi:hypothetical protein